MTGPSDMRLPPSLHVRMAVKMWFVNLRVGVCGEGVGDQIAKACLYYKDGRVGSEEKIDVCAV